MTSAASLGESESRHVPADKRQAASAEVPQKRDRVQVCVPVRDLVRGQWCRCDAIGLLHTQAVDLRQPVKRANRKNPLRTSPMHSAVYRLIAILLMLWLPLQAVAGIATPAPACLYEAHSPVAEDAGPAHVHDGGSRAHHAAARDDASATQPAVHMNAYEPGSSSGPQCADCLMACGVCVQAQTVTSLRLDLGAVPAVRGAEDFASAAANRALEPPIAAA
jgi:hypothetical protein